MITIQPENEIEKTAAIPDFTWPENDSSEMIRVMIELQWRKLPRYAFWTFTVFPDGPMHEGKCLTIDQARAIAAAVVEFDTRAAGY